MPSLQRVEDICWDSLFHCHNTNIPRNMLYPHVRAEYFVELWEGMSGLSGGCQISTGPVCRQECRPQSSLSSNKRVCWNFIQHRFQNGKDVFSASCTNHGVAAHLLLRHGWAAITQLDTCTCVQVFDELDVLFREPKTSQTCLSIKTSARAILDQKGPPENI